MNKALKIFVLTVTITLFPLLAIAQYGDWTYKPDTPVGNETYRNIINYNDSENNLKITVSSGAHTIFGEPGKNFTIYKTNSSGAEVLRTDLANVILRGNGSNATLQFGGDGVTYTASGYNGGTGAADAWAFYTGKTMSTSSELIFQSGGNGTNGVAGVVGDEILNGGTGGTGGGAIYYFEGGTATFNGVTQFGGNGGHGGVGANATDKYYATKGGTGGAGGSVTWGMVSGSAEFNNSTQFGGDAGRGANGGVNMSGSGYAEHGNGGIGGTSTITMTGGSLVFNNLVQMGGDGGYAERGNGGVGGAGTIQIMGGELTIKNEATIGATGGQSTYGTGGEGGRGYIDASGGSLTITPSDGAKVTIGGTGGVATGVGANGGTGGQAEVYLSGANVTITGSETNPIQIGGDGGEATLSTSGTGGNGIIVFSGGIVNADYVTVGGSGGQAGEENVGSAGAGGEANIQFNGGTINVSNAQLGGDGGNAMTSNSTAGAGGTAVVQFNAGTNTITNVQFGGNGGIIYNTSPASKIGVDGGAVTINFNNGSVTFNNSAFGGQGGDVYTANGSNVTGIAGGTGGNVTLNAFGGNTNFSGITVVGGVGGSAVTDSSYKTVTDGGQGGTGGSGIVNVLGGIVKLEGLTIIGGIGGNGNDLGLGGSGQLNLSYGMIRLDSKAVIGGMDTETFVTLCNDPTTEVGYSTYSGVGNVNITGGSLTISKDALITSFNEKSAFTACGGSILFNVDPNGGESQTLGQIVMPSITISGNSQLGVTMDEWKQGMITFDTSSPILIAKTSNQLQVDANSFTSLFYTLETYRGSEDKANEWYLKSVEVKDLNSVWSEAGKTAQDLHNLNMSEEAQRDVNNILYQSKDYNQLNEASDQVAGALYSDALTVPLQRITSINQVVLNQIMQANGIYHKGYVFDESTARVRFLGKDEGILANNNVAPWGGVYGGTATTSTTNTRTGFDDDTFGYVIGLDLPIYTIRFGGYYAFGDSNLDSNSSLGGNSHIKGKDHLVGLYMKWNALLLTGYWSIIGNYGWTDYESMRSLPNGVTNAKYGESQWGVYAERGWSLPIWLFNLNPYLSIQYESITQDGFLESGSSNLCFGYDKASLSSCRGMVGLRGIMNVGVFKLTFSGAYFREMGDSEPKIRMFSLNTGDSMTIYGLGDVKDWWNCGAGATLNFGQLSIMANYNLMINGQTTFHSGMVTLRYKF